MFKDRLAIWIVLFIASLSSNTYAQELQPSGQFLSDSVALGEPVKFTLALKYPKGKVILFPDSTHGFDPFELEGRQYFTTVSDPLYSYDSVIYTLATYEIDEIQYLRLPVYLVENGDSTNLYTPLDSIVLKQMVEEVPDSISAEALPLKENTTYRNVPLQFNYPYWILGLGVLLFLLILGILLFGNRIRKWWKLRKLSKSFELFNTEFDQLSHTAQNNQNSTNLEAIIGYWKKYLEKLERRPYSKLTTKELDRIFKEDSLTYALKRTEKAIYANNVGDSLEDSIAYLKYFAMVRYEKLVESIKNG